MFPTSYNFNAKVIKAIGEYLNNNLFFYLKGNNSLINVFFKISNLL